MFITRTSVLSGITRTQDIPIREEDYRAWGAGATIQTVAGYLSVDDREFIISGITPDEWDKFIPKEEELFDGDDDEPIQADQRDEESDRRRDEFLFNFWED